MSFTNLDIGDVVTVGQVGQYGSGTSTAPDATYNPVYKISRTISQPGDQWAGSGQTAGHSVIVEGTPDNQVQTVAYFGAAVNTGTSRGTLGNPDACPAYFYGVVRGQGIGCGLGFFAVGEAATSTARGANGGQVMVVNNSGSDVPAGTGTQQSKLTGLSLYARGSSPVSGAGLEVVGQYNSGVGNQSQFDVGIRILPDACKTAAMVIEPGAGPVRLGQNYPAAGGQEATTGGIGTTKVSLWDVVRALKEMEVLAS